MAMTVMLGPEHAKRAGIVISLPGNNFLLPEIGVGETVSYVVAIPPLSVLELYEPFTKVIAHTGHNWWQGEPFARFKDQNWSLIEVYINPPDFGKHDLRPIKVRELMYLSMLLFSLQGECPAKGYVECLEQASDTQNNMKWGVYAKTFQHLSIIGIGTGYKPNDELSKILVRDIGN